ncbi:FAD-dependent monooxygenase [Kineosporia sp. J2-2]|uniref:FAD-dependent monooxygenase n=1 Tax=Kineosporia corallincola TaxID=2835133 RepID=A0ABS5TFI8_9ACTN|nr:NAD(P)/FAD-dependent oxidoreductase [Kineosporia corallincola]MBT0769852.1 FAD-dependent monooxygenase [Kineosporia corallincola]
MRVTIVGAGVAGLALARILHLHGIETLLLERDSAPNARSQGGTLDLHPESGQYALEAAGLIEDFHELSRPEGEEHKIFSPAGELLVHHVPEVPGGRPEIDRTHLRDLLIGSLPPGTLRWGARVVAAKETPGEGFRLDLADGTQTTCDLLIGADGGRSVLRPLLVGAATSYLRSYSYMVIPDIDRTRPDLGCLVGQGTLWALGDNQNLVAQRESTGQVRVAASVRDAHPWHPAGRDDVLARYADWSPTLTALIEAAAEPVTTLEIRSTPADMRWPSHPALTLIGDAAHLMAPTGEGANQALRDAADLAAELAANPHDQAGAIARFEARMWRRIGPVAESCARLERRLLSPTALDDMVRFFTRPAQTSEVQASEAQAPDSRAHT